MKILVRSDHKAKLLFVAFACYGFNEIYKHGGELILKEKFGSMYWRTIFV